MRRTGLALILAAAMGVGCATTGKQIRNYTVQSFEMGDTDITPSLETNLQRIADVKNISVNDLGFSPSNNYLRFTTSPRKSFSLYITPKTVLPEERMNYIQLEEDTDYRTLSHEPMIIWSYVDDLSDEKDWYEKNGFDVFRVASADFDDGNGCDLYPGFFKVNAGKQISLVLHEDWHHTFKGKHIVKPHREINESSASAIGYLGAVELTERLHGRGSEEHIQATQNLELWEHEMDAINLAYHRLSTIYHSDVGDSEKFSRRQEVFDDLETQGYSFNNARLWRQRAYAKHKDILVRAFNKAGGMKKFIDVLTGLPRTNDSAIVYLDRYIKNRYAKK